VLIVTGAGTGGVLLLRWYWWRINAWSEVASMICAAVVSIALQVVFGYDTDQPKQFALVMLTTVAITTIVWLAVTYLTAPEPQEKLLSFYRRTRRRGAAGTDRGDRSRGRGLERGLSNLLDWIAGCTLVYGVLFGVGNSCWATRRGTPAPRTRGSRRLCDLPRFVAARLGYSGGVRASLTRSATRRRT